MKKILDAIPFLGSLVAIDLLVFFLIYFFHTTLMKGFPITEAVAKGGYELLWRVISLQLVIQVALLLGLAYFNMHKNLFFVLASGVLSIVIATIIAYSASHIPKLLTLPNSVEVGEAFAIVVSLALAWLSMRIINS